ncbi:N-acetylglucosamine kinase [Gordonia spumicola]|uniref:N-acetylglucosamine kinase n=1 Tax=Gordonia spumicola TaxID=589161 RepID=A0A7I9V5N0_9ACTN|nr:BadF/BadG/BcrA/BcrD ATPase family protein [Gordonia spumicola]GEE00719.1 N-acetylglucosamine kinase [Gordonia spumicola]
MIVALDSGGTSSKALVIDGPVTRRFESSATLSGYLDPSRIQAVLRQILAPIHDAHEPSGPVTVRIAAAGFIDGLRPVYRKAALDVLHHGFGGAVVEVSIANDAVALLVGHDADAVVVAGTGSNVLVRASDGRVVQGGGHDWVAADDGSAFWIGLHGIRQVARDHDDCVDTPLVRACEAAYSRTDVARTLRDLAVAGPTMKADIAAFARSVAATATDGDPASRAIIDGQAAALAQLVDRTVARAEIARPIRVVGCGGMFNDAAYRAAIRARVASDVEWTIVDDGLSALTSADARWDVDLGSATPLRVTRAG